ncbi:MAG TPA: response regulator, partial [Methanomassiliicoccales archaeon]|nr:response regulator [Methanomassiliicoccales archaeon]
ATWRGRQGRRRCDWLNEPKRVLIVDDSMVMRRMIQDLLSKNGFAVAGQAKNGVEAVDMYTKTRPDLVTMDVIMPGETGVDVVKRIISMDRDARIMMVSGLNQKTLVLQALQNGAKEFIVKPFQEKDLLEAARKTAR